jgi:membrane protein implicated in regulation of membrane protease activity
MIAAMILFTIAIGVAVWCITVSSMTKEGEWLLFLIFTFVSATAGAIVLDSTPTNKDVRKRRAHYVEQNHIEVVNGDTINTYKTYKIEWIENSK